MPISIPNLTTEKFYKQPINTYVFVENVWLDDIYRLDFRLERQRAPIYGWNDVHYGIVAEGKQLIVGNILIHFTQPGYLVSAINEAVSRRVASIDTSDPYSRLERARRGVSEELLYVYDQTAEGSDERKNRITQLLANSKNQGIQDEVIQSLRKAFIPNTIDLRYAENEEPIDIPRKHFNIQIYYGHPEDPDTIIRELKQCVLTGQGQTISAAAQGGGDMSSSAQTILEVYPFMAQRMIPRRNTNAQLTLGE